jgi:hypothetical protein
VITAGTFNAPSDNWMPSSTATRPKARARPDAKCAGLAKLQQTVAPKRAQAKAFTTRAVIFVSPALR